MSDILLLGIAIGMIIQFGIDHWVYPKLARILVRHGRR